MCDLGGKVLFLTHKSATLPKGFWRNPTRNIGQFRSREPSKHKIRAFFIEVRTKSNVLRRMNRAKR